MWRRNRSQHAEEMSPSVHYPFIEGGRVPDEDVVSSTEVGRRYDIIMRPISETYPTDMLIGAALSEAQGHRRELISLMDAYVHSVAPNLMDAVDRVPGAVSMQVDRQSDRFTAMVESFDQGIRVIEGLAADYDGSSRAENEIRAKLAHHEAEREHRRTRIAELEARIEAAIVETFRLEQELSNSYSVNGASHLMPQAILNDANEGIERAQHEQSELRTSRVKGIPASNAGILLCYEQLQENNRSQQMIRERVERAVGILRGLIAQKDELIQSSIGAARQAATSVLAWEAMVRTPEPATSGRLMARIGMASLPPGGSEPS